jgi:hypothetical protein
MMLRLTQRSIWLVIAALAAVMVLAPAAFAHHGWGWATDEEFQLTGKITGTKLGNPHGEVTVEAQGATWVVEVGQPWRNDRAGLSASLLSAGRMITVHGHRSAKQGERLVKAERIVIDGKSYNLYPDRKS